MRINTNLTAMNTFTQYTKNNNKIADSVAKLSSGFAINSAADNAAGLAISEKMRAQIRGLNQASTNAQDAISLTQTAEGSLAESTEILQRMRELAVQSANDTNNNKIDREALQDEFSQLQNELNEISSTTSFNKKTLLDGSLAKQTSKLSNLKLAKSGLSVELGNVDTGSYSFNVKTRQESAAIAGKASDFTAQSKDNSILEVGAVTSSLAESSLANGNYTVTANYDASNQKMVFTAAGDNGQTFTAELSNTELTAGLGETPAAMKLSFGNGGNEAFNFTIKTGASYDVNSATTMETLATTINQNLSLSAAGGVDEQKATYGLYASLTGADDVKLSAGMDSVTFSNGVKVNFDELSTTDVSTTNASALGGDGITVTNPVAADVLAGLSASTVATSTATGATFEWDTTDTPNGIISDGEYSITDDGSGKLTLTDGSGKTFVAEKKSISGDSSPVSATYEFVSTEDSAKTFKGILSLTNTGSLVASDITLGAAIKGTAAYNAKTAAITASSGTASLTNISAHDDSSLAAGDLKITAQAADATTSKFVATANGKTYTATIATADLKSAETDGSKINTLSFLDENGNESFTADLKTTNNAATGVSFTNAAVEAFDLEIVGERQYDNVFGTKASTFNVESVKGEGLTFQVGANSGDELVINIDKMDANYLGVASASVGTQEGASKAIDSVDKAINQVSSQRAYLGAIQNRLDHKIANLNTSSENLTAAESQIRDVDMAKEMTAFTNANILSQAATAMLAQANSLPQNVLSLIG